MIADSDLKGLRDRESRNKDLGDGDHILRNVIFPVQDIYMTGDFSLFCSIIQSVNSFSVPTICYKLY